MPGNLDIKMEIAYRELKRSIYLYFSLMLFAFIAVVSFLIYGLLNWYIPLVRIWSIIVVVMLFLKLGYDAIEDIKRRYQEFKEENDLTDKKMERFFG